MKCLQLTLCLLIVMLTNAHANSISEETARVKEDFKREGKDFLMEKMVSKTQKKLPRKVGTKTTMVKVAYSNNNFYSYFEFPEESAEMFLNSSHKEIEEFSAVMRKNEAEVACKSIIIRALINNGIVEHYVFALPNKKQIIHYTVDRNYCQTLGN